MIFPYRVSDESYSAIPEDELRERWPRAYAYLLSNKARLERRRQFKEWYAFSAPRNLDVHQARRWSCRSLPIGDWLRLSIADARPTVSWPAAASACGWTRSALCDPLYVLGLVNSKLLFWYLRHISNRFRGGWITCTKQYFGQLPIRVPSCERGR